LVESSPLLVFHHSTDAFRFPFIRTPVNPRMTAARFLLYGSLQIGWCGVAPSCFQVRFGLGTDFLWSFRCGHPVRFRPLLPVGPGRGSIYVHLVKDPGSQGQRLIQDM